MVKYTQILLGVLKIKQQRIEKMIMTTGFSLPKQLH